MSAICTLGVTALLVLAASAAGAGEIRGVLVLTRGVGHDVRKAGATAREALRREAQDAVVYLESIPPDVERRLAQAPGSPSLGHGEMVRIALTQRRFEPRITPLVAGSSVEIRNRDSLYHNTFSISAAKRFDLGRFPPGRADTVRFDRLGVVNLHCEIHPEMIGYVVVVPNHAIARPDSSGAFVLPALPRGDYTLRVWLPRRSEVVRTVHVPARGVARLEVRD